MTPVAIEAVPVITPCVCARGKVISCVCRLSSVTAKITRFEDSGILVLSKCDHIVRSGEKLSSFSFLTLDTRYEHYKSCEYVGHAY